MIRFVAAADDGAVPLEFDAIGAGPPVVLLHGFPEFRRAWRNQLPALARAGFRAIAPDLRGTGRSPRPREVRAYRLRLLVEDVAQLIRTEANGRAVLVGHDWGGVLAWLLAGVYPELVERLVIINAPHPIAYAREVRRPDQALRSWYAGVFQLPWLPEKLLQLGDYRILRRTLTRGPRRRDAFDDQEIDRYVEALSRPGALTAALNYYRAAVRYPDRELVRGTRHIGMPTLIIWGRRDRYLSPRLLRGLRQWVPDLRMVRIDATHWIHHELPDRVNELILEFLNSDVRHRVPAS